MSTNANKKPPTPDTAAARRAPLNSTPSTGAPSRSPSRMNSANGTAPGVSRTKSVRSSTPAAAKAAARKGSTTPSVDSDEVKAEMQSQLSDLQSRLDEAETATTESERQKTVLQTRLDEASKEQLHLEEQHSEHLEQIEELQREKKESLRHQREMEQIYEGERAAGLREKEERESREEELKGNLQRMKETLAQREMRASLGEGGAESPRPSVSRNSSWRQSVSGSPNPGGIGGEGQFAPPRPDGLQRSDSQRSSKIVMQKDKIIEGLRLDLAEAEFKLVEVENMGGGRLQELQKTVLETKMQNARLMEENESFQLLLQEKTLNGDFSLGGGSLLRPASNAGSRPSSRHHTAGGTTLADELESQVDDSELLSAASETDKRLQTEIHTLKEQNKALTLYINNIVSRLLQHGQFEHILDKTPDLMSSRPISSSASTTAAPSKPAAARTRPSNLTARSGSGDKDLPPPPPESPAFPPPTVPEKNSPQQPQPQGFLQRAKSVIGASKPRPRPLSQAITPSPQTTPNLTATAADSPSMAAQIVGQGQRPTENPDTAPTIPIGRGNRSSVHRRGQSEWSTAGAAGVTNNMYRGPGSGGPLSPGRTSPGAASQRNSFFSPGNRTVSSGTTGVPSRISEDRIPDENLPPSVTSTSAHNATLAALDPSSASQPDATPGAAPDGLSAPASPPRSTVSSSGDSSQRDRANNPIMMGSKMRPLRLVQEAKEEAQGERERKVGNRGSWFGWMGKGGATPPAGPGRSVSGNGQSEG